MSKANEQTQGSRSSYPNIVTRERWLAARRELLAREKAFTRDRDALSEARRELPMVKVEKRYVFEEPSGHRGLADLFSGHRQLIVYHFMFDPSWAQGCKSCSFVADHFAPAVVHLQARDTALVAISRAPSSIIEPFKRRMGWSFRWVSSHGTEFNQDYGVSFTPEAIASKTSQYNYASTVFSTLEAPGVSVFLRDDRGDVFHTYSTYGRGLDALINTYNYLDLTPLGRHEDEGPMNWVRHHDKYSAAV